MRGVKKHQNAFLKAKTKLPPDKNNNQANKRKIAATQPCPDIASEAKKKSTRSVTSSCPTAIDPTSADTTNLETMEYIDSNPDDVLSNSDDDVIPSSQTLHSPCAPTVVENTTVNLTNTSRSSPTNKAAHILLNDATIIDNMPDTIRRVYILSQNPNDCLSKQNPFAIDRAFTKVCGEVKKIIPVRSSGGIYVECNTLEQTYMLLSLNELKISPSSPSIGISVSIAKSSQTSSGKIYAPELNDMNLCELLNELKPKGVISVRKLLNDPTKSHIPLFVLTFMNNTCPNNILLGRSSYKVDPYIPRPLQCFKCWRWGHGSSSCRSQQLCCKCGCKDHTTSDCPAIQPKCINCKDSHLSSSKECPINKRENDICKLSVTSNIPFPEARKQVMSQFSQPSSNNSSVQTNPQPLNSFNSSQSQGSTSLSHNQIIPSISTASQYFPPLNHQINSTHSDILTPGQNQISNPVNNLPIKNYSRSYAAALSQDDSLPLIIDPSLSQNIDSSLPQITVSSLPPISQSIPNRTSTLNPQIITNSCEIQQKQNALTPSIKSLVEQILPILIKLLFSNSLSSKVQCIHDIGILFSLEDKIENILSSLDISSAKSTEHPNSFSQ